LLFKLKTTTIPLYKTDMAIKLVDHTSVIHLNIVAGGAFL